MTQVIKTSLPTENWTSSVPVRIVVPDMIDNKAVRTPVLYLLHGLFGNCDNWIELTHLLELMNGRRFIVVTAEGYDSWYVNSVSDERRRYEDFFIDDLMPWIDREFSGAEVMAIAGLSMGGYGAVKFGIKRPDRFKFVWSSSGAFVAPRLDEDSASFSVLQDSVSRAFGPRGTPTRLANDVFKLVNDAQAKEVPEIHLDCGQKDEFLAVNRQFETTLSKARIRHSYSEPEGGHDWDYWNRRLAELLTAADGYFH
jgi:S-formylglutathione hydrolase FrmB